MSVQHTAWAWNHSLPPTAKLILLALCELADMAGVCDPPIDWLADRCGVTRASVTVNLRKLVNCGALEIQRRDGHRSLYVLTVGPV